jgi:RNA polymerase sigma factor (sigma-70 family)
MPATDQELLDSFVRQRDTAAFAALLERHGPMVLGVCRRLLRDSHAAEDAFQATFLVLAQKAADVRRPEALGGWLYSVATRLARKLRADSARRDSATAGIAPAAAHADPIALVAAREIHELLDEELGQLPAKYRTPIVLCYLEGQTAAEAARALHWPASSLASRLQRALDLLRQRLARRGAVLSAPLLATALAEQSPAAPAALLQATARTATLLALGRAGGDEQVSATALALAQGLLHTMRVTKIKIAAAVMLILLTMVGLAGVSLQPLLNGQSPVAQNAEPPAAPPAAVKAEEQPPENPADPLEAFREALKADDGKADPRVLEFRKANLMKRAQELRRVGDLRQALALQEWRHNDKVDALAAIDGPIRKGMIERFTRDLRKMLQHGAQPTQIAALTEIAEVGVHIQGVKEKETATQGLVPDVARLVRGPAGPVRDAAARTLGHMNPEPKEAAAAWAEVLKNGDVGGRRGAAAGLAAAPRVVLALAAPKAGTIDMTPADAVHRTVLILPVAGQGLADDDLVVRRNCLEALVPAATLLAELGDVQARDLPTPGRPLSDDEQARVVQYRADVERVSKEVRPLADALNDQVPDMIRALGATDANVCLAASQALEEIAATRQRLLSQAQQVARYAESGKAKVTDDVLVRLPQAIPRLVGLLSHKDVRVRLGAIYVLETMGGDAAPAAESLVKALEDDNSFVRWGAARALGKMAPRGATVAVPALGKCLDDSNNDVRLTAVAALERFGPAAAAAVPQLVRELERSKDFATRLALIRALGATGKEAGPAVAALSTALTDADKQVRVGAARALGKLGPVAQSARNSLLRALSDPEPDVRQAAAEALLAVP